MRPIISLKNVGVKYKRSSSIFRKRTYFEALKSINLDIYKGDIIGVLGRNGAGKSTLLRVIAGVLKPNSGTILNRGVSVSLLALQAGFDPNLSGRDNAIMSGMLQGHSKEFVLSKLKEIEEYAELGEFFNHPTRTYSTGMNARLGFSVGIIAGPEVLLLDEVLSVGDAQFRIKAERTMRTIIGSTQSVVFVSHSHSLISRLCSKTFIIKSQ